MSLIDANSAGFVHGGTVMKLCDEAAGLAAIKHSRSRVVTAGMDRMTFNEPVHIAELVTFKAAVNAVWRTSMEVGVRVESENPRTGTVRHTSTAYLTMVAVDEDGRPAPIPHARGRLAGGRAAAARGADAPAQPAGRARRDPAAGGSARSRAGDAP